MEGEKYLDAHTHSGRGDAWDFLMKSGITFFLNTTSMDEWEDIRSKCLKISDRCVPFFGIHPMYADKFNEEWFITLKHVIISFPPGVKYGIGEIGLDNRDEFSSLDLQKDLFIKQLELAAEFKLPVSIHTVRSWGLMFDILKDFYPSEPSFMFHSYNGSVEMMKRFAYLGGYFSFSPDILLPWKKKTRNCLKQVPLDKIFLETDSRGDAVTLKKMYRESALLRGVEKSFLCEVVWNNGKIYTNGAFNW